MLSPIRRSTFLFLVTLVSGPVIANAIDTDLVSGLVSARNGLHAAERSGDLLREHAALRELLSSELRSGAREEVVRTALRTLDLSRKLGDPRAITEDLWSVAEAFARSGQSAKAIREGRNAVAMSLSLNDPGLHTRLVHGLIDLLLDNGELDEADRLMREVEDMPLYRDDAEIQAQFDVDMARLLEARGRNGDALVLLSQAQRVLTAEKHPTELLELLATRVQVLLNMGRASEAGQAMEEAGRLVAGSGDAMQRLLVHQLEHAVALARNDVHGALRSLQRIKHTDDSLRAAEDAVSIAVLQVMHDMEQREVDNAALREEIGSKERTILAQRTDNGILTGLVVALAILLLLLGASALSGLRMMRRMKLKNAVIRKQNEEIEAQHRELIIQNERLAESILGAEEKELLLKEIHHRMKNNLQVVESLLSIQMARHESPVIERLFREAQGRVRAMAMVHDMMYRYSTSGGNTLQGHFSKLVRSVLVAHGIHDRVSFTADIASLDLPEEVLLPLTLLVNELVTNAAKHAFSGSDQGHLLLALRGSDGRHELVFQDSAGGRTPDRARTMVPSFGTELIALLVEQLGGVVTGTRNEGGAFKLEFGAALSLRKAS
ncbi:MAG: sensor histidine kinase [Flavobacteriales bacterium]